ncbi:hypothetical protein GGI15_000893 [Coemansia interrupta]|uniref:WD40 repeat-like protein n=1 Tax=Coemansia interrupta TaxID=1126814 RepID=A0A9W8HS96_9FUNG|nr:hypothetical protein GGI15_000893 [Coemansia interrupta]
MTVEDTTIDQTATVDETAAAPAKRIRLDSPEAPTIVTPSGASDIAAEDTKPLTQEHIFQNLRLRRIVRENHNGTVAQLALMFYRSVDSGLSGHGLGGMPPYERTFDKRGGAIRDATDNSNLLGTIGGAQASIFDNENCGDHLDIMSHFQLASDKPLRTCCWVRSEGDALLAVAGDDQLIHIISLAWNREIRILRGHSAPIVDLQPHPTDARLLLSVGADQTVRVWSVFTDLSSEPSEPHQLVLSDSILIVTGKKYTGASVDCIRFAKDNLLVKNTSGRIEYWDLESLSAIRAFSVRHHGVNISRFDVSFDDEFICAGNSRGEVYVFGIDSGRAVARLVHKRSVKPVTCCLFTRDCRSIVYSSEGGFIWRYDYVDDETLAEWEKHNDSASEDSSLE